MTAIDLKRLAAPFPPDVVSWRIGSTNGDKTKGMALAYLDSRDVQDRLDEVCGAENWQVRHPWSDGKKLCCEIGIRIDGEWVWKGDGAGDSDVEAEKGAFSDSFKRAGVRWGIGRYLYDLASPWVEIETKGRSSIIKDAERHKLRAVLERQARGASPAASPPSPLPPPPPAKSTTSPPAPGGDPKDAGADDDFSVDWKAENMRIDVVEPGGWEQWRQRIYRAIAAASSPGRLTAFRDDNNLWWTRFEAEAKRLKAMSFFDDLEATYKRRLHDLSQAPLNRDRAA